MIAVRGLTKKIGRQEILRGIDLTVARGETLGIIGRSGGGKSVLLKHIIGLMLPDAGEIWIDGENIIGLSERKLAAIRQKVGILFQGGALFDSMTVEENIAFPLREAGERDRKIIREKVNEMLEVIELEGEEKKMPVNLSGGMKKRVGLARSIIRRPSCVLYDEPTAGLDPPTARTICELAIKLRDLEDVSSIFVTHEMNNLEYLSSEYAIVDEIGNVHFENEGDRLCLVNTEVIMLRNGKIIFSGKDEKLRTTDDPYIHKFIRGK